MYFSNTFSNELKMNNTKLNLNKWKHAKTKTTGDKKNIIHTTKLILTYEDQRKEQRKVKQNDFLRKATPFPLELAFFSSNSIMTLKRSTSLTTTSSFLYRIWKVLLQMTSSWTDAGKARSEPEREAWRFESVVTGYNGRHAAAIMCCLYELLGAKFLIHVVLTGSNPPFEQRAKRRKKIQ